MNKIFYDGQVIVDIDNLADKYTKAESDAKINNMKFKNTSEFLTEAGEFNYSLLQETFQHGGFLFNESQITVSGVNIQANSIMQVSLWYSQIVITLSSPGEMIQFIVTNDSCTAFRFTGTEVTPQQ